MKLPDFPARDLSGRRVTFKVAGVTRALLVHAPAAGGPPPTVVLAFHGGGGTAALMAMSSGWNDLAEQRGYLVIYPEAIRPDPARPATFLRNPQMWNVGSGVGHAERLGVDDVAFVAAILDWARVEFGLENRPALALGFSMGASMAYRAAAELPGRFRALAAVSGHWWTRDDRRIDGCSLLTISGDADPVNPLQGGPSTTPWGDLIIAPPIRASVEAWARAVGSPAESGVTRHGTIRWEAWQPGRGGEQVKLCVVGEMGHAWPGGQAVLAERYAGPTVQSLNATLEIDRFFQSTGGMTAADR